MYEIYVSGNYAYTTGNHGLYKVKTKIKSDIISICLKTPKGKILPEKFGSKRAGACYSVLRTPDHSGVFILK